MPFPGLERGRNNSRQALGPSQLISCAKATPMLAEHAHGGVDLAHHDDEAIAHVSGVALDEIGPDIASRAEACPVIEDAAVAAVGGIPGNIIRLLRPGIDPVMHGEIPV